jgi:IS5 family transposase
MLILQSLYNLSDEQIEYQVRDRMSFTRFLGLEFEDDVADGTTLWLFREKLAQAGLVETLFERFNQHLNAKGTSRAAARWWTRRSCRFRGSATAARRTRP